MSVFCVHVCGVCNGPGEINECGCADIPEGDCDCNGNVFDECGICGGDGIPAGECDCDGNQLDALGECGGGCESDNDGDGICDANEVPGCTDEDACNYDSDATEDDGSCGPETFDMVNFLCKVSHKLGTTTADQWHSAQRPGMVSDMFGRIAGDDSGLGSVRNPNRCLPRRLQLALDKPTEAVVKAVDTEMELEGIGAHDNSDIAYRDESTSMLRGNGKPRHRAFDCTPTPRGLNLWWNATMGDAKK